MCNRFRMTEAQIALAARYGVEAPFPPDHTIPPPELFTDKPAYVVRLEGNVLRETPLGALIVSAVSAIYSFERHGF